MADRITEAELRGVEGFACNLAELMRGPGTSGRWLGELVAELRRLRGLIAPIRVPGEGEEWIKAQAIVPTFDDLLIEARAIRDESDPHRAPRT